MVLLKGMVGVTEVSRGRADRWIAFPHQQLVALDREATQWRVVTPFEQAMIQHRCQPRRHVAIQFTKTREASTRQRIAFDLAYAVFELTFRPRLIGAVARRGR